jgi:hypothetical protein
MDLQKQSALLVKECIYNALREQKGCLIGRWGTIEFEMVWNGNPDRRNILEKNAGVFPMHGESDLKHWQEKYVDTIRKADCLATGWYAPFKYVEQNLLSYLEWKGNQIVLRALEPYYVKPGFRWTSLLQGKKVCVVSSFTETGKQQVAKGSETIWGEEGKSIWPSGITWSWVQTGYAPVLAQGKCTWSEASGKDIQCWQDAVNYMVEEVMKTEAEIVIIGCGGLGMIVGSELKSKGKVCIVMGGATQVFLGICGKRWKTHDFISCLWNKEWVYPSDEETPGGANQVEGGCYW